MLPVGCAWLVQPGTPVEFDNLKLTSLLLTRPAAPVSVILPVRTLFFRLLQVFPLCLHICFHLFYQTFIIFYPLSVSALTFFSFSEIHPRTPWGSGPCNRILSRMFKCNQQPLLYHQSFSPFVICRNKKWWLYSAWEICLLLWWGAEMELSLVICCQWRMKTCKVRHVQGHPWTLAASGRLSRTMVQKDPTYKRSSCIL